MIGYAIAFVFATYLVLLIRASPGQRAASVTNAIGGERGLDRAWETVGPRFARYREIFDRVASEQNIPANLLAGIAWRESDFRADARNTASGAAGLMQVMPLHFATFNLGGDNWKDPYRNITAGARILRQSGYGTQSLAKTLANYGGFVNKDPSDYVRAVQSRATFISLLGERANG